MRSRRRRCGRRRSVEDALDSAPVKYLDLEKMAALDAQAFQTQKPFPWMNPPSLIRDEAFAELTANLPDLAIFDNSFNVKRKFGQQSHDRFNLEYDDTLEMAPAWHAFVSELRSDAYRDWLARMLGTDKFSLRFHWQFAPGGCSVSPHCDSKRKLGSHIFYLNPEGEWDPSWGGGTCVLDDGGRLTRGTSPAFEDFDSITTSTFVGNYSFLFRRDPHSWHGVREWTCPEGHMRKVFTVVIDATSLWQRLSSGRRRKVVATY